ncbi:hypothetical protein PHISCL_05831, partial [Aspergillus sclerotialis]
MFNWLWPWSQSPSPSPSSSSPTTPSSSELTLHTNAPSSAPDSQSHQLTTIETEPPTTFGLQRKTKLLIGGATFITLSLLTTRRAFRRRIKATTPGYYTSSTYHKPKASGPLEALEAAMHATLHVFSWTVFGAGVTMTYLDVNTLPEFRRELRRRGFAITKDPGEGGAGDGTGSGTGDELEEA